MPDRPATALTTETAMVLELGCRQDQVDLVASENIVSRDVPAAPGPALANKYAEGSAARRYYGRCEPLEVTETVASDRPRPLLDAGFGNVQPPSTQVQ